MVSERLAPHIYAQGLQVGSKMILSKTISLSESTLASDQDLLAQIWPLLGSNMGGAGRRIAITGPPGVGKSTFIEALGMKMLANNENQKLAVLAIDPSSSRSHGSILGDKTRMEALCRHPAAYIRPSAAAGAWGGVANHTRTAIELCQAAGFQNIIIETVGVGQSETLAAQMCDCFLLLLSAGSGDELQGIKRGIMEMADLIVINKADTPNDPKSNITKLEYQNALSLMQLPEHGQKPQVLLCSALHQNGFEQIEHYIHTFFDNISHSGFLASKRHKQSKEWIESQIKQYGWQKIYQNKQVSSVLQNALSRLDNHQGHQNRIVFDALQDLKTAFEH